MRRTVPPAKARRPRGQGSQPAVSRKRSGNGSQTAPFAGTAPGTPPQPPRQASGQPATVDTAITATAGGSAEQACAWGCGNPPHPGRFRTGCPGPARKHGLSGHHEPAPEPAGGWRSTWPVYRGSLHTIITEGTAYLQRRSGSGRHVGAMRQLLDLVRDAQALDAELSAAADGTDRCGWGHPNCPFAATPELEADILTRAACERLYPRLMVKEADVIAEALVADADLRDDVLHRIATARADAERQAAEADGVPHVITFGPGGEVISLDEEEL